MSEAEALRLDDMFRRSIRKEGLEEGEKIFNYKNPNYFGRYLNLKIFQEY